MKSKEFLEAGKQRLAGNTKRGAGSREADGLRSEGEHLKALGAELTLKNRVMKKACRAGKSKGTKDPEARD